MPGQCLGPSSHYMEDYYSPVQYCQYTWKYQCQGTLYVGSHAGRANNRTPVACISGADCDLLRVTSGILLDTHLFVKFKHSFCWNPHQSSGWTGLPTNQVPPVVLSEETLGDLPAAPNKDDCWRPGPPRPRGMVLSWARTGQGAAA